MLVFLCFTNVQGSVGSVPVVVDERDDASLRLVAALLSHVALQDLLLHRDWNGVSLIKCKDYAWKTIQVVCCRDNGLL